MAFKAEKKCSFGGVSYQKGDTVPVEAVDKDMVGKLIAAGKLKYKADDGVRNSIPRGNDDIVTGSSGSDDIDTGSADCDDTENAPPQTGMRENINTAETGNQKKPGKSRREL